MTSVNQEPACDHKPLVAEHANLVTTSDGQSHLEIQVNIGGQPRIVQLSLDALEGCGVSGPAGVAELRRIVDRLGQIWAVLSNDPNRFANQRY